MKISVAFILVFICSIFYSSLGTTHSQASTETIAEVSPNNAESSTPENIQSNEELVLDETIISSAESEDEEATDAHINIFVNLEEDSIYKQENEFLEVAQNSGVANEITNPSLDIIHTLVDSATLELQEKAEELSGAYPISDASHYISNSSFEDILVPEPTLDIFETANLALESDLINSDNVNHTEELLNKVPSNEPKSNTSDSKGNTHEEIPSFSEWTQKQLEEAERKKEEVNASAQTQVSNGKSSLSGKKRWKNYASPDCGAKIIATNPEAISAGSVLSTSRDEYKLNACTNRIWFVVELCEAIQAKKIDLANFELFSSSPKDFSISVSDRYPSRDWSSVGHFTAKDERDIQSFDLHPHLFGKYIKFEMHSHHGSEHYCPISLFRVYGTSEFEVLETENQVHTAEDDDDDETLDSDNGVPTKNLFSSATDAVISIVKKAAEVLGNKANQSQIVKLQQNKTIYQYIPLVNSCTTPSHMVVCNNCTDLVFGYVFELLSCKSKQLVALVNAPIIKKILYNTQICSSYGLEWHNTPSFPLPDIYTKYMISFFAPKYIAAMCNTVAVSECKVVLNISSNATIASPNLENISTKSAAILTNTTPDISVTDSIELAATITNFTTSGTPIISQIKPTKTLSVEDDLRVIDPSDIVEDDKTKNEDIVDESVHVQNVKSDNVSYPDDNLVYQEVEPIDLNAVINGSDGDSVSENSEALYDPLDNLVNELNGETTLSTPVTTASPPTHPQQQKESVFLRLSNRLKALELNMSLSGQYLEELSRRYKKQVEEMQRLLDKTIITLNEDNKKKDERAERLEQEISTLKEIVETLIEERNRWIHTVYWLVLLATLVGTLLFCRRNIVMEQSTITKETSSPEVLRRRSIDVVSHKTSTQKKRRPSEEALVINTTYTNLLIDDNNTINVCKDNKKRKKRKQKVLKSNSSSTLTEEPPDNENPACKTVNSNPVFYFAPKLTSSRILRPQIPPPHVRLPLQWVEKSTSTHCDIQDIPFVLDESEHSSLEPTLLHDENMKSSTKPMVTAGSKEIFHNSNHNHKIIGNVDETEIPINNCEPSLNGTIPDSFSELPRREKKSFIKKIFKNFSFK